MLNWRPCGCLCQCTTMYCLYKWIQHFRSMGVPKLSPGYGPVGICRVLARPSFMMFYVIFPIHLNFPIRSRYVFKVIIQRKKMDCFIFTWESFFFFKKTFYNIVYACVICYFSCYLSCIYYSSHIMFFTLVFSQYL